MDARKSTSIVGATQVLLLTLLVLAAAAGCSAAINPLHIEAARTAARVKTALVNDPLIGTRVINVKMLGSVAQLSGRVRSDAEAARAIELARAVTGVTQVDSRLQIGSDPLDQTAPAAADGDPPPSSAALSRGPGDELQELEDGPGVLALGAAVGWSTQRDLENSTGVALSPLIKIGTGSGLAPGVAFDWFSAYLPSTPDVRPDNGRVRLRPVMAGLAYTRALGRVAGTLSIMGGYSFNSLRVPGTGDVEHVPVDVSNSLVWRPAVEVWVPTGKRTAFNVLVGRVMTSPQVTFVEGGRLQNRRVSADLTVVLFGVAYTLF